MPISRVPSARASPSGSNPRRPIARCARCQIVMGVGFVFTAITLVPSDQEGGKGERGRREQQRNCLVPGWVTICATCSDELPAALPRHRLTTHVTIDQFTTARLVRRAHQILGLEAA